MVTGVNNKIRFGGLASGMDTDSMIKQLMQAERRPLDKLMQNKQSLEWKRDAYREVTNTLRSFRDDFFDVLKSSSNMRSSANYKKFTTTTSDSAVATATGTSEAMATNHQITVLKLATAASATSAGKLSDPMIGSAPANSNLAGLTDTKFNVTLDGQTKTITLSARDYGSVANLASDALNNDGIQQLLNREFGAGRVTVSETAPGSGILKFDAVGTRLTVSSASTNDGLVSNLKMTSGASNYLNRAATLDSLKNQFANDLVFGGAGNDELKFTINNATITVKKTETLNDLINKVNNSSAGVTLTYSEINDQFILKTKETGATQNNVTITNTNGNFFGAGSASGILAGASLTGGQDAEFNLDGVNNIIRSTNSFTVEGVSYTLKSADPLGTKTATIGVTQDVDSVYNNIKSFVDKYNELIVGKLNAKLSEAKYRDFQPLTDEQKEAMSEDDVKKWEEKAKSGLIKEDAIVKKVVADMRTALFDSISGITGSLSDIGITTGSYFEKGKLVINETKLKEAIRNNPDQVEQLFAKSSTVNYSADLTGAEKTQRYQESGVVNRLYDVIQDNIRTIRDKGGNKGTLLEKAGISGDASDYDNSIYSDISMLNKNIDSFNEKLARKEDGYYRKFAALEKALSQMNSQSSWLSSQLGGL